MNLTRWLIRMAQMVRHPPPWWKVRLVLGVIGLALLLAGIERLGLWPEWARLDPPPRPGQALNR